MNTSGAEALEAVILIGTLGHPLQAQDGGLTFFDAGEAGGLRMTGGTQMIRRQKIMKTRYLKKIAFLTVSSEDLV